MQRLHDPENGCPWDKEQTFTTIVSYTLEETYEVLDAIACEDFDDLHGKLGDLLSQVVLHAQMAQEEGRSDLNDICTTISNKLERHHPRVFTDNSAENSSEVLTRWKRIKTEERAQKAQYSALDDIPRSLPALVRTQKVQKRRTNADFDWMTLDPVVDKVYEEIGEVIYEARWSVVNQVELGEEIGGLPLVTVSLARHLGTKAEIALQETNEKSERRLHEVECIAAVRGLEMTGIDLETMEEVW